jgi:hypothetical protein
MAKYKGKVVRSDLEGGFWTLQADDGAVYKLEGGDAKLEQANLRVEVEGAVDGGQMGIGFGAKVLRVKSYKVL